MAAIGRFWHSLARAEKAILLVCSVALLFVAGSAWSRSRSLQESPLVFEDSPKAENASNVADATPPGNTSATLDRVTSQKTGAVIVVHVVGEVYRPGVLKLNAGSRVVDAVEAAGGVKPEGDGNALNLAQELRDGQQVRVPRRVTTEVVNAPAPDGQRPMGSGTEERVDATLPSQLVNVNTASAQELETLPGIGPALSERIIAQRAQSPFSSLEDLDAVGGLGPKKLEKLKPFVTF